MGTEEGALMPMSIKDLNSCIQEATNMNSDSILFKNENVEKVTLLGRITSVEIGQGKHIIKIDDGSSEIAMKVFVKYDEADPAVLRDVDLEKNKYCKVIAT